MRSIHMSKDSEEVGKLVNCEKYKLSELEFGWQKLTIISVVLQLSWWRIFEVKRRRRTSQGRLIIGKHVNSIDVGNTCSLTANAMGGAAYIEIAEARD